MNERWVRLCWNALDYRPNVAQGKIIHEVFEQAIRFIAVCGGERAGKSLTSVALALALMRPDEDTPDRMYWIVGPDYAQARAEFAYFHKCFEKLGIITSISMPETKTQPWVMETSIGVRIETRTSADVSKLASFTVHGVLMAEAAQQTIEVWYKLRGRVSETRGWVILSGTLEESLPWYDELLARWEAPNQENGKSFTLPSWSNTAVYPGGYDDPEIVSLRNAMPTELFEQRYGAKRGKRRGLVVPEFEFGRNVKHLALDETRPIELWIDPGQHTYAVWFVQVVGQYVHCLDAVYKHGWTAYQVIPECKKSPLWKHVRGGVIDVAGTQRHANKSQVQIWSEEAGISLRFRKWRLQALIDTVRARVGGYGNPENSNGERVPLVYFSDTLKVGVGADGRALEPLSEFSLWQWRETGFNSSLPQEPIDKNNDAIKALGYGLLDRFGVSLPSGNKPKPKVVEQQKYWM